MNNWLIIFFVTPDAIGMWENGKRIPKVDVVIKIADFFNLSLDDLLLKDLEITKHYLDILQADTGADN